jgi:hypothetical protein
MTEDPNGVGWWQASDGLWYPPETHPGRTGRPPNPAEQAPGRASHPPPHAPPPYGAPPRPGAPPPGATPPYGTPPPGAAAPYGSPPPGAGAPYGTPPPGPGNRYGAPPPQVSRPQGPAGPQPQPRPPMPPQPRSGGGCGTAIVVLIGMAVVAVVVATAAVQWIRREVGEQTDRVKASVRCDFLTEEQASQVIEGADVVGLEGITSVAGSALDRRVLRDAPACLVSGGRRLGRVAREVSEDAEAVFERERAAAVRGSYNAGPLGGLGDEAFCTGLTRAGAAGVLVRDGDVLVYASISPEAAAPTIGPDSPGRQVARRSCRTAQQLAEVILTG